MHQSMIVFWLPSSNPEFMVNDTGLCGGFFFNSEIQVKDRQIVTRISIITLQTATIIGKKWKKTKQSMKLMKLSENKTWIVTPKTSKNPWVVQHLWSMKQFRIQWRIPDPPGRPDVKSHRSSWSLRVLELPVGGGSAIVWCTLWLYQNSYWKWPFIMDIAIETGDFP